MSFQSTWQQYLVIDRSKATDPLQGWLDPEGREVNLPAIHDYLAGLFPNPGEFGLVRPPVWRFMEGSSQVPAEGPELMNLPLQFYSEEDVGKFLTAFQAYMDDYYRENGHPNPVFRGLNTDMAVQVADFCRPTDVSGFMMGRRTHANALIRLDKLTQVERDGISGHNVNVVLIDEGIDRNCIPVTAEWGAGWTPPGAPAPAPGMTPPQDARHSTMMVRNILAVAPKARFFDVPLIRQPKYGNLLGFISAAHSVFGQMFLDIQNWRTNFPGKFPGPWILVNAWAPFDLRRELPKGGYSNNPLNDFNVLVNNIVASGIDVIFCAGNCGAFCPDGRCGPNDTGPGRSILGAASHPRVISVGAVRVDGTWIGYSSQGPGQPNLSSDKPDICGPSGFAEDRDVFASNDGTSAASAIVAGAVAALRTRWPPAIVQPDTLRAYLNSTARRVPGTVWDRQTGYGILDIEAAYRALRLKYP